MRTALPTRTLPLEDRSDFLGSGPLVEVLKYPHGIMHPGGASSSTQNGAAQQKVVPNTVAQTWSTQSQPDAVHTRESTNYTLRATNKLYFEKRCSHGSVGNRKYQPCDW